MNQVIRYRGFLLLAMACWVGIGCCPKKYATQPTGPAPTPTPALECHPTPLPTPWTGCDGVTARQMVYNAFNDFSFVANPVPGGAWRYGFTATLGGTFTPYTIQTTQYQQDSTSPLSLWQAPGIYDPNVAKNETGTDFYSNEGDWVYHPASTYLHFHPGPNGEYSVVRWTCPQPGTYHLEAGFRSLRVGGPPTTTDIHVLKNGSPLFDGTLHGYYADGEQTITATLELQACQTVDFTVGYGDNGNYFYDSSGIRAVFQPIQP